MKEYRYRMTSEQKKLYFQSVGYSVLLNLVLLFILYQFVIPNAVKESRSSSAIMIMVIPVLLITFWIKYKKQLGIDYLLAIDEQQIFHSIPNLINVTITKDEVTRIEELPSGTLLVVKNAQLRIMVPKEIEAYPEIRNQLSQWMPFTPAKTLWGKEMLVSMAIGLIPVIGFIGVLLSTSLTAAIIFLIITVVGSGVGFYILHQQDIDSPMLKRFKWIFIIPVLLALGKAYMILSWAAF